MIEKSDIEKLSKLARIKLSEAETESLKKEVDSILSYIDQINEASEDIDFEANVPPNRNVLREDKNPHESGIHTEKIIKEAPSSEGEFIKTKNIL